MPLTAEILTVLDSIPAAPSSRASTAALISTARLVLAQLHPGAVAAYGGPAMIFRETIWGEENASAAPLEKWVVQTGAAGCVEGHGSTLTEAMADAVGQLRRIGM